LVRDLVEEVRALRAIYDVPVCVERLHAVFERHGTEVEVGRLRLAFAGLRGGVKPPRSKDWAAAAPMKGPADFAAKLVSSLGLRGSYARRVERLLDAEAAREDLPDGRGLPAHDIGQVAAGVAPSRQALATYIAHVFGVSSASPASRRGK
jgi:hypothetical protein